MKTDKHIVLTTQQFKRSLLAVCIVTLGAPTLAQAQDENVEEIVIKGVRASLQNAQEIKRNADTFVDAISASDISSLPDKSVLEALQRVPGISIERYASATDPDHFSIEGSGITLRGLPQTRSEFNGRDSFSADSGRGLSFQDVPPELMSKVEVYKNQTADLIEGGISGTINLNTRKPFDSVDRIVAFSAGANYADLVDKTRPSFSGLYSDRWNTDAGEFGVLVSVATSRLASRNDGVSYGQIGNDLNKNGEISQDEKRLPSDVLIDGKTASRYVPANTSIKNVTRERSRDGGTLALQWKDPTDTLAATFEYVRSSASQSWMEHNFESDDKTGPLTNAEYNDTHLVKGRIDNIDNVNDTTRYSDQTTLVEDYSLNFVYTPSDELTLKADIQHIKAKKDEVDVNIQAGITAATEFDFSGKRPKVLFTAPGGTKVSDKEYFSNPSNYFWLSAMDHLEDSAADEDAIKLDAKYIIDKGILKSVETGVRFSDRQQNTQWSTYNWGKLSAAWDGTGRKYFDGILDDTPWDGAHNGPAYNHNMPVTTLTGRDDIFGSTGSGISGGTILAPGETIVKSYADYMRLTKAFGYKPAGERDGLAKGPFKPNELNDINERNNAAYVKINFGSEDDKLTGNLGVRYVVDKTESTGGTTYANQLTDDTKAQLLAYYTAKNDLKTYNEQVAWHSGTSSPKQIIENTYSKLLPSLNLKYAITDDVVGRFAVSKAISYANVGDLRNYKAMYSSPSFTRENGASDGKVTNVSWSYSGGGGNPMLKPMESTNVDLSAEWYFGRSSSLFAGVFLKDMNNFFASSAVDVPVTNNGVTREVTLSIPYNIGQSKITGFEAGYQQFYDKLPAPFDGLGLQMNITLLNNSGDVPNSGLDSNTPPDGSGGGNVIPPLFNSLPLQGMSNTTYNIVAMYEKDAVSARIAWNWRSEYLLTSRDVISRTPVFAQASGQMDASLYYNITDDYKVGIEGSNLLNELTWTKMQVDQKGTKAPRNFFINDRRFSIVFKGQF
jgi:TonB-dependent receptor